MHRVPEAATGEGLQRQLSSRVPSVQVQGEVAAADDERESERIMAGGWPFQRMADQLLLDLLDAHWHVRHGAAIALRHLLHSQASSAAITFRPTHPASGLHPRSWIIVHVRLNATCIFHAKYICSVMLPGIAPPVSILACCTKALTAPTGAAHGFLRASCYRPVLHTCMNKHKAWIC